MRKITLSPSSLSIFKECKRCFWLQTVRKKRRPNGIFPSLPNGMDKILKQHFDNCRKKGMFPPDIKGKIQGKLFNDMEKLKIWRNNWKGLQYEDKESGIVLRGALDDLLITPDGKHVPIDFKTRGFPLKDDTPKYYQHQMDIYCFLLEKNQLRSADFAYLIFYHPKKCCGKGQVEFNIDVIKMETDKNRGEKLFLDAVELLKQEYEPEPNDDCEWCCWNRNFV